SLGYTITGFLNGDGPGVVSGAPSLATTANAASGVGSYPITVGLGTLSARNYDFPQLVAGTLRVTPAPLTVRAADQARGMGHAARSHPSPVGGLRQGRRPLLVPPAGRPHPDRRPPQPGRRLPDPRRRGRIAELHDHLLPGLAEGDQPAAGDGDPRPADV